MSDEVEPLAFLDLTELPAEKIPEFKLLLEVPVEEEPPFLTEEEKASQSLPEEELKETIDVEEETRKIFEEAFAQGEKAGHEMGMKKVEPLIERAEPVPRVARELKAGAVGEGRALRDRTCAHLCRIDCAQRMHRAQRGNPFYDQKGLGSLRRKG